MGWNLPLYWIKLKQWLRQHFIPQLLKASVKHSTAKVAFEYYDSPILENTNNKEYLTIFEQGLKMADPIAKKRYVLDHLW